MRALHRRSFLRVGSAGLAGLTLPAALRAEAEASQPGKAKAVILVWLGGGPATIDMWDLKPDAPEEVRGEFKPIATAAPGVRICEHLPKTAKVMDKAALVRSLAHSITAHDQGAVYMATGHPPTPAVQYPSLGALAAKLMPAAGGLPPYISFDSGAGFPGGPGYLGPAWGPFAVEGGGRGTAPKVDGVALPAGFTSAHLADRDKLRAEFDTRFKTLDESDLPAGLDRFQSQALDVLRSDRVRKAFDVGSEKDETRERYGRDGFGTNALAARRLVEAGARFVTVGLGGWDTHAGNFRVLGQQLLPQLDRVLAGLVSDLAERGLLDSTVVYCAGEFARTPRVNGTAGRDHWARSMAAFLAGGGIRGGTAYGSTDAKGEGPAADACSPADVSATLFHLLGLPPTHEVRTASGRPMQLFRDGKVLKPLVG